MTAPADQLLAEPIRRSLWRMGWESLRTLQEEAIRAIVATSDDVILSAKTAAGKTEAAFLPVLSLIGDAPVGSVRALYVGPLKALINDQFRRLEELCQYADIPVHRWHGDVSGDRKRRLAERPGGVLLITPESLESLLINRSQQLAGMFHSLSFVVIDELHALLGGERGTQLRSQLFRLGRYSVSRPRLVALSATIGDLAAAARWMDPAAPETVRVLRDAASEKAIRYRIHGYVREPAPRDGGDEEPERMPPAGFFEDVYENFRGTKNLIFANSKGLVEELTDRLNELGRRRGTGEEFLIHHGSLSRDVREDTERRMQGERPHTAVCSSTLELGIDIGSVRAVGQVGPPWSVSSLVQRLGRSGRREGEPHQMRLFVLTTDPGPSADLHERLHPGLLQAVALTELMLEPWVESPDVDSFDLSTLVQQTLSVIAETGGATAPQLFERLVARGAFRFLDSAQFATFLRGLARHDLIEQRPEGPLILGLAGERLVAHYDFYAAFTVAREYRVVHGTRLIGLLPAGKLPREGDHVLLAGRRWQVVEVDDRREEIAVRPAAGRKAPLFESGDGEIDPRVRRKMREVLTAEAVPQYVDSAAAALLESARDDARRAGLLERDLVPTGMHRWAWFPWTGTRAVRTLDLLFEVADVPAELHRSGLSFSFAGAPEDWLPAVRGLLSRPAEPLRLIEHVASCERRKWDRYVSPELLSLAFIHNALDIDGARGCLESLADYEA